MSHVTHLRANRPPSSRERPNVVALHCSGGSGRQWRHLAQILGSDFDLTAPELTGSGLCWHGNGAFRLSDEARRIVSAVDHSRGRVHLVGHSYGGGVALRVAMERPYRVASLTLYEPTPFHVLRGMGPDGRQALHEIRTIAAGIRDLVSAGHYHDAAHVFVDYWNGIGTFLTLSGEARANVARFMPHALLHFHALCEEGLSLMSYRRLRLPLRIFSGTASPLPAQRVAAGLARAMNPGALRIIEGVGHMGPISAPAQIAIEMADHIRSIVFAGRDADQSWSDAA